MDEEPVEQNKPGYSSSIFSFKNIIIYLVVAVLAYGGILYFYKQGKNNKEAVPVTAQENARATESSVNQLVINLVSQNDSTQDGTAILTEENGKTKVEITLSSPNETPEPAHIHAGSCPTPADVMYPLTNVVNGASETIIDTTIAKLRATLPLAINVHKSAQESKIYVACGDVS